MDREVLKDFAVIARRNIAKLTDWEREEISEVIKSPGRRLDSPEDRNREKRKFNPNRKRKT